ncbi:MAG: Tex-like N-terminal domain-containing protein [Caldilineaceae bacterium]
MSEQYANPIAQKLGLAPHRVAAVIALLDDGNTLPFIARYRKEATGGLDEEEIRAISSELESARALDERRATILASIEEQGKLTDSLRAEIMAAETRTAGRPLPAAQARAAPGAMIARVGLEPLAEQILTQPCSIAGLDVLTAPFLSDDVPTSDDALAGARDIIAELISDHPGVRQATREKALKWGAMRTGRIDGADDLRNTYELYYDFEFRIDRVRPHQVLAINRGEAQKILRVAVDVPERDWRSAVDAYFRPHRQSPLAEQLQLAIDDAASRLLLPAIERDVRRTLTEQAEAQAMRVFGANLRGLLTQPPLADQTVLALDPGFRTGCKVAVIDPTGKVLAVTTIYPHPPQKQRREALAVLTDLVQQHRVNLIAVGNGTASRRPSNWSPTSFASAGRRRASLSHGQRSRGQRVWRASPLARADSLTWT